MKKIILTAVVVLSAIEAHAQTSESVLRFEDLPYSEGTLYLQVLDGDKNIFMTAIEVTDAVMYVPVDFSEHNGKELSVKAFLDLNENGILDFDDYGRPEEACLQTNVTPETEVKEYNLKLVQY